MNVSLPVLIVDDSRTMTTIISKLVRDVGFTEIDYVNDGPAAVDRLREKTYGLLLPDWDMRAMNGTELTQKVRNTPKKAAIPLIMVTTNCGENMAGRHVQADFREE